MPSRVISLYVDRADYSMARVDIGVEFVEQIVVRIGRIAVKMMMGVDDSYLGFNCNFGFGPAMPVGECLTRPDSVAAEWSGINHETLR